MRNNVMANKYDSSTSKKKYPFWVKPAMKKQEIANRAYADLLTGKIQLPDFFEIMTTGERLSPDSGFALDPASKKKDQAFISLFEKQIEYVEHMLDTGKWDWEENKQEITKALTITRIVTMTVQVTKLREKYGSGPIDSSGW
jgi:hypothetical protein